MFNKTNFSSSLLSALMLLVINTPNAQIIDTLYEDSLCAYTWNSDFNNCPEVLDCIYPGKWKDTIIDVPANITHISKTGLKLCLEDLVIAGSVEIIYIMDLSSSMNPGFGAKAGDPYKKRPSSLKAGFQYQIDSLTSSRAGYIGFQSSVQLDQRLKPVAVNTQAGKDTLNYMVGRLQKWVDSLENQASGCGTNYRVTLDTAIKYFADPTIVHDSNQVIIFISDGEPMANVGATAAQVQTLITNKIPVYGIFLGDSIGKGLDTICTRTSGKSYLVPPSATDTLAKVIKSIVKSVVKPFAPKGLVVLNNSNGTTSVQESYTKISDTVWSFILNKPIPLKKNLNEIQLNSIFGTPDGQDTILSFKFNINVGGDTTYTSECFYCWYRTQIRIYRDAQTNINTDSLTMFDNSYNIRLFYYGLDTLDQVNIKVYVKNSKDTETIILTNPVFDSIPKQTFSKTVPFAIVEDLATPHNNITEACGIGIDQVTFYWNHPAEPIDTSYRAVLVVYPTYSSKSFLSLKNQQITILQKKINRGTSITVQFAVPVKNAEASLLSVQGRKIASSKSSGTKRLIFNNVNITSGVYLIKISAGQERVYKKIILTE